ncbi:unnamed protein product [Didymodactylos carnosus]|uniref:Cell wall hydrolase SleB domain-containing protein n=1 Tax=Didymodactylos carnosus TaxID=1234261 RepID=A0A814B2W3_9BILA|nr:unnamed protein product [Didymodactylos carnosus]CAF0922494.1 unnamed protein product [Didymodactylos carnosus]CAF3658173.1 unnamed protein product [Didymodactylos carnosus]CAF3701625.1 unnamed protein product [Didymodactylos carnosus]
MPHRYRDADVSKIWHRAAAATRILESGTGQAAIIFVMINRVKLQGWLGKSIRKVIEKPKQFPVWNNRSDKTSLLAKYVTENDISYKRIGQIIDEIKLGKRQDNTYGSTHYHTKNVHPNWSKYKTPTVTIDNVM